ncbi:MAG: L,D-transpeptidase family protein [Gemmatimonadales bacterium]|jgi:murein L,D-transpeptidase YcbB/YkuD|nr:L,D-transpeptidase family protein [Gemmatimonadales bacterium]
MILAHAVAALLLFAPARDSLAFATEARRLLAAARHPEMRWPAFPDVRARAESLYVANDWRPLWLADGAPSLPARRLAGVLRHAELRGLPPDDFDGPQLAVRAEAGPPADPVTAARFDLMLTLDALRLVEALDRGRIAPRAAEVDLQLPREHADVMAVVQALRTAVATDSVLASVEPRSAQYQLLKRSLVHYRALGSDSGLVPLPALPRRLRPGMTYPGAAALRRLLRATGDLPDTLPSPPAEADTLYDDGLVAGVRTFQRRSGFGADGVIGDSTAARLNRPFADRLRQIELTLERWRWLPRTFESPPIIVNIPAYRLVAFTGASEREDSLLRMNVVVGRAFKSATPVFTSWMTYVAFSPYWEVPKSIERQEIRPAAQRHPGYLARHRMELLRGGAVVPATAANIAAIGGAVHVRQKPGDGNSLGRVKFMLPNNYAVYLHDTPAKNLFEQPRRDYSHGCIRLADPVALARFVLRDQPDWTPERIAEAMQREKPLNVTLARRIPVLVLYGTAVARESGATYFYGDVYGHDRTLDRLLRRGFPYAR